MTDCELVFGLGPAGTGKTYLAVCFAVECLRGEVKRIILSRPAVEAGEHLGFLPETCEIKSIHICGQYMMPCTIQCHLIKL